VNSQNECQKLTVACIDFLALAISSFLLDSENSIYLEIDSASEWTNWSGGKKDSVGVEVNKRIEELETESESKNTNLEVENDFGPFAKNSIFLDFNERSEISELRISPIEDGTKKRSLIQVVKEKGENRPEDASQLNAISNMRDLLKFLSWNMSNV
jgi:hypothetical protein